MKREDGLTIVEVAVAALVLALGALAVLGLLTASARNSFRTEQSQVVANRLQDELEKFRQLADNSSYRYDEIALTSVPAGSSDPSDPAYRVSGSTYAVNRNDPPTAPPSGYQSIVVNSGGIAPTSRFASGDVRGTIHRYVVWEPSSACPSPAPGCLKRVIVSIALDHTGTGGVRRYQEMQTLIGDPRAQQHPGNPGQPTATPWTFWLTDTPCGYSDRQPIVDSDGDGQPNDHLTHNTRGGACTTVAKDSSNCTSLLGVTSCPAGPPDLMVTHPPPVFSEEPLVNFATDVLSSNPSQDKGLRTFKPATDGCPGVLDIPTGSEQTVLGTPSHYRYQEIHKWVSPQIPSALTVQLNGTGSLSLWTRTVGGVSYNGAICVWLFQRQLNLLNVPVDTPLPNLFQSPPSGSCVQPGSPLGNVLSFTCVKNPWPSAKWTEVNIPLSFTVNAQLVPGSRLGLAIAVERSGTSGGGLQFIYDEPSYESRLQVNAASQLPF